MPIPTFTGDFLKYYVSFLAKLAVLEEYSLKSPIILQSEHLVCIFHVPPRSWPLQAGMANCFI